MSKHWRRFKHCLEIHEGLEHEYCYEIFKKLVMNYEVYHNTDSGLVFWGFLKNWAVMIIVIMSQNYLYFWFSK